MMLVHSCGSAVFTLAAAATGAQLLLLLLLLLGWCLCGTLQLLEHHPLLASFQQLMASTCASFNGSCRVQAAGGSIQQSCGSTWTAVWDMPHACANIFVHAEDADKDFTEPCQTHTLQRVWQLLWWCSTGSTWLFVTCTVAAQCAMGFMYRQVFRLFRVLSPNAEPQVAHPHVCWALVWAGWLLSNAVLPCCMLYTYLCNRIEWSGVVYHKQAGKVVKVVHKHWQCK